MANYYRELAFALRLRGLDEQQIASTLDDVAAHSWESRTDARAEFGDPHAFAARFEQDSSKTAGRKFVAVMVVLAVIVAIGTLVGAKVLDLSVSLGPFSVSLFAALLCALVGLAGGFVLDRRLPRGFVPPKAPRD